MGFNWNFLTFIGFLNYVIFPFQVFFGFYGCISSIIQISYLFFNFYYNTDQTIESFVMRNVLNFIASVEVRYIITHE